MKLWFYFDKAFPDILPLLNVVLEPAEDVGKKEKPQDGEHDEQLIRITAQSVRPSVMLRNPSA